MTLDAAVSTVRNYLTAQKFNIPVYKYDTKPDTQKGEYIAVNALPFSPKVFPLDTMNINIHVPISENNIYGRLSELVKMIRPLFDGTYLSDPGIGFYLESESQPDEDKDNTYFVNLKIKIYH